MPCHVMPCIATPCHVMKRDVTWRDMTYYAMSCYATSRHVMQCYVNSILIVILTFAVLIFCRCSWSRLSATATFGFMSFLPPTFVGSKYIRSRDTYTCQSNALVVKTTTIRDLEWVLGAFGLRRYIQMGLRSSFLRSRRDLRPFRNKFTN